MVSTELSEIFALLVETGDSVLPNDQYAGKECDLIAVICKGLEASGFQFISKGCPYYLISTIFVDLHDPNHLPGDSISSKAQQQFEGLIGPPSK